MDRVGKPDVERVVVLHEGRPLVVEHQLLQGAVQVVGLREAVAPSGAVDDAVLHLPIGAATTQDKTPQGMKAERNTRGPETRSLRAAVLQSSSRLPSIGASHPRVPPAPSTLVTETPFTSQDLVGLKWLAAFGHSALDLN